MEGREGLIEKGAYYLSCSEKGGGGGGGILEMGGLIDDLWCYSFILIVLCVNVLYTCNKHLLNKESCMFTPPFP